MTFQCTHCQSRFFKTLETRFLPSSISLLYKKRCKRCKYKFLLHGTQIIPRETWLEGHKVELQGSRLADRARIFVSEYTRRISHLPEEQLAYLARVARAQAQSPTGESA